MWGAPDIWRHAPGNDSFIDASAFASAGALAAYLTALAADEAAYAALHAWRTRRSFADYGDVLRDELLEMVWVGNATMEPAAWYACRWCHALERAADAPVPPLGIPDFKSSERAPWPGEP